MIQYRRHNIGFLYQSPRRNLIWNITAFQNIIFPMKLSSRWGLQKQKQRTNELLKQVGLEKRANHKPHELSGGEKQRVGIARALANDPIIILADEPTGDMDSVSGSEIMEIITQLNKNQNKTIVNISHDEEMLKPGMRLIRMDDGRIISDTYL